MDTGEKPSVYLETSVISYVSSRLSRDLRIAAHQQVSQEWWERRRGDFRLVISDLVLNEIAAGDSRESERRLELVRPFEVLSITNAVKTIAAQIVARGVLPQRAVEDALHVTCAAVHGVDYLLTWNCRHIANAEIERKLARLLMDLGCDPPWICTPLEMLGGDLNG